ncbi:MAG: hypothetical protein JNM17_08755 [Archangium sp.]|nr:hypothetical protein [Archangium sp.]
MRAPSLERLRDRFFSPDGPGADFQAEVDAIDALHTTRAQGLPVCFHPTRRFKSVRYVDHSLLSEDVRSLFARPIRTERNLCAVFVDPRDLSFHDFENILSLDRHFDSTTSARLTATNARQSSLGSIFTFTLGAPSGLREKLDALDGLGLYVPPFNASARGGERFIFHCASLAAQLTALLKDTLPQSITTGLVHVNPVFRCNRFEPGDEKFHEHHDTPYFDRARRHVSRHTLLLYLTEGEGRPALQIEGMDVLTNVERMTCVVFDQKYAHEGRAFASTRKVFLRTELICTVPALEESDAIAAEFAKATYLTSETTFRPELAAYGGAMYERAAEAHWTGIVRSTTNEPFLLKTFRGVRFASNGYDFFFAEKVPLDTAALLAFFDVVNASIGGVAFKKACTSELKSTSDVERSWLRDWLSKGEGLELTSLPFSSLFPPIEAPVTCCPTHMPTLFDPSLSEEITTLQWKAQAFTRERLEASPVQVFGKELFVNALQVDVTASAVHLLSKQRLERVNFAACWNSAGPDVPDYLGVESTVTAYQPLVPPIPHFLAHGLTHLCFDLFRNSWWVDVNAESVPIPVVLTRDEAEDERLPRWLDAADPLVRGVSVSRPKYPPFWARARRLVDLLYADEPT